MAARAARIFRPCAARRDGVQPFPVLARRTGAAVGVIVFPCTGVRRKLPFPMSNSWYRFVDLDGPPLLRVAILPSYYAV